MMENIASRRNVLRSLGIAGIGSLAGCTGDDSGSESELRAAFVYQTELADVGWARAHDDGRQAVNDEYDWLETDYSDAVGGGDARPVFEQYANDGYDVIFGCTTEYMDPIATVAEQYPDITFEHCNGTMTEENMGRYMGRAYEAWYLCGVAAGHLTESNTLGMIVSIPIPELVRQVNAFTLGARAANSDVMTAVRWLNAWYDPPGSTQATNALLDEGADVIASTMASPAAVRTASENEVWSMAANTSMAEQGGDYYATSQVYNWEAFYGEAVQAVRDGTWSANFFWGGLDTGVVGVDDFGPQVPADVTSDVEAKQAEIENGELDMWEGTAFEGEDDDLLFGEMGSYVDGVQGEVPSGE